MLLRRLAIIAACTIALLFGAAWLTSALGDDNKKAKKGTLSSTETAAKSEKERPSERFDYKVREDLFAGFSGDNEALQRGLKVCEETLVDNPRHAEALVWRGAVRVFRHRGRHECPRFRWQPEGQQCAG